MIGPSPTCNPEDFQFKYELTYELNYVFSGIGLNDPSTTYQACTLMKPEYRKDVSEQYRKKIENIVRKPPPDSDQRDVLEANLPCMYCGFSFAESQLDCLNCSPVAMGFMFCTCFEGVGFLDHLNWICSRCQMLG